MSASQRGRCRKNGDPSQRENPLVEFGRQLEVIHSPLLPQSTCKSLALLKQLPLPGWRIGAILLILARRLHRSLLLLLLFLLLLLPRTITVLLTAGADCEIPFTLDGSRLVDFGHRSDKQPRLDPLNGHQEFLVLADHVEKPRSLFGLGDLESLEETCAAGDGTDVCATEKCRVVGAPGEAGDGGNVAGDGDIESGGVTEEGAVSGEDTAEKYVNLREDKRARPYGLDE